MSELKMVYGVPPRPSGRPMLVTDIADAQKKDADFEPGWKATPQGYINERFDAVPIPIYAVQTEIVPPDPALLELDPGEEFGGVIGWITLEELNGLLVDQEITCGFTLASLAQFKARLEHGSLIGAPDAWLMDDGSYIMDY